MSNSTIPPQKEPTLANIEAEVAVLGSVLYDASQNDGVPTCLAELSDVLRAADFYREQNRIVYNAMLAMQSAGTKIDVVTLAEHFRKAGNLEKIGGLVFLNSLAQSEPTAANVLGYAEIVRDYAKRRALAEKAVLIRQAALDESNNIDEAISKAQESLATAMASDKKATIPGMKEVMLDYLETLNKRAKGEDGGISTGYPDFDRMINGLQSGTLHTIAARPGMGKTAFALNIAAKVCREGHSVLYFSMEMPRTQMIDRLVSAKTHLTVQTLKNIQQKAMGTVWERVMIASESLSKYRLYIDDRGHLSYSQIASRAISLQAGDGLDLIIVDHIQIMGTDKNKRYSSRANELDDTTAQLKALAMRLDVPIIILSQLNRKLEERDDKVPKMSDLRESGGIEQNSDTVSAIYRPGYYEHNNEDTRAQLEVLKSRDGQIGTVWLTWAGAYTSFAPGHDWTKTQKQPAQ